MPVAEAPMPTAADLARFKALKSTITDYFEFNAGAVREKKTVMATATRLGDMLWLCEQVRRLDGYDAVEDKPRFDKTEAFVARACEDHAGAIATGAFIKVRADLFAAYRFLVRCLELVFKYLLAPEDVLALGKRLKAEHQDRVVLDLEEGLGDGDAAKEG